MTAPLLPKYRRLERKELLMWPGQLTQLGILARRLNRTRGGRGERITSNTLIRVGIALVLERARELDGATEEELRRSLGLKATDRLTESGPTDSGTAAGLSSG